MRRSALIASSTARLVLSVSNINILSHRLSFCVGPRTALNFDAPFDYGSFRQTCFPIHILHWMSTGFCPTFAKKSITARWSCLYAFGTNVAIFHASAFFTHTSEINECSSNPLSRCRCFYTPFGGALVYIYATAVTSNGKFLIAPYSRISIP